MTVDGALVDDSLEAKLAAGVEKRGDDECWGWRGTSKTSFDRGIIRHGGDRWLVHRAAYAVANGPIPPGMDVCHDRQGPACANPRHLILKPSPERRDQPKVGESL
jgi:hypothetical protein